MSTLHEFTKVEMVPPFRATRSASAEKLVHLRMHGVDRHVLSIHLGKNGKVGLKHVELPRPHFWTTVSAGLLGAEMHLLRQYFHAAEVNRIPFPPHPQRTDNYDAIIRAARKVARFAEGKLRELLLARNNAGMTVEMRTKYQATRFTNLFRRHEELTYAAHAAFRDLVRLRNPRRGMPIPSELAALGVHPVVLALDALKQDLDVLRAQHSELPPAMRNGQPLRSAVLDARAARKPLKPYVIKRADAAKVNAVRYRWSPEAKARGRARRAEIAAVKRREDDKRVRAEYEAGRAAARAAKKQAA